MTRALAPTTWWQLIGGALLATVAAVASGAAPAVLAASCLAFVAVAVAVRPRMTGRAAFIPAIAGLACLTVLAQILLATAESTGTLAVAELLQIAVNVGLIAGIGQRIRVDGNSPEGIFGDGLIVGLGAWIVGWVTIVQPRFDGSQLSAALPVVSSFVQPTAGVVLFLVIVVLCTERRHGALWLSGGAITLKVLGDAVVAAVLAGHLGEGWRDLGHGVWVLAFAAGIAALTHPTASALPVPVLDPSPRRSLGRLAITTSSLVFPLIVLAVTGPADDGDNAARAVSAVVLAIAVTFRVLRAVQSNNRAQEELLLGAQTDPLTGLPNRALLIQRVNACLDDAWRSQTLPTLYFVDLDRFKTINDSLGHAAGDEVLRAIAERLVRVIPEGATVARLSGDEYVVLDPQSKGERLQLTERLLDVFREPLPLDKGDVFVTASIGVAKLQPNARTNAEDLLRHADTAMYRAKDAGRNRVVLYDESMHEKVRHRLELETALYRALDRRELRLFHQPIIDLQTGDVVGFEALMRWQQANGTIVAPNEFIPIAEETGTIVPIGSWALLEALSQLREWIDEGVCSATATTSVNVSPRQLADPNFPAIVSEALSRSRVDAGLLWLEITENMMISEPELALSTLRRLRSLGVRVALDDFGTGYSSLSLLQRFPLQRIKIDRAFVQGVANNGNDRSLVRTIIAMGSSLGLDMVAEGVESVHQLQVLSELGCTKAQGYLISRPIPSAAMRSTVSALERLGQFPGLKRPGERPGERVGTGSV